VSFGPLPLGNMSEHDHGHAQGAGAGTTQEPPVGPVAGLGMAGEPDERPASTGDDRVDAAVRRLAELDESSVHEHAAAVEAIHRTLQDALAEDEG
jgi:hypothetical protein